MEGHHDLQEIEILGKHAYIRNYLEITLTKASDAPKRMSRSQMTQSLEWIATPFSGRKRNCPGATRLGVWRDPLSRLAFHA